MSVSQSPTSRSPVRTVGFALGAFLIAVLIAWIVGEVVVRAFSLMDRINVHPRRLYTTTDDPRRPYALRAGESGLVAHSKSVRVNSLGMREEEVRVDGSEGGRRILVLGDSIVFGWGLDEAETFSVQLEQELRARGRPARVLNGGTAGYNTLSELATLEALAPTLDPELIILGVSLNDFTVTPRLNPQGYLSTSESDDALGWLERSSELYVLWRWFLSSGQVASLFSKPADDDGRKLLEYFEKRAIAEREKFYQNPQGDGLERIVGSLQRIRAYALQHRIEFVVVVFPEHDQVREKSRTLNPQARWREWCLELELRCLDLHPAFVEGAAAGNSDALFDDLQHPSALGIKESVRATAELLDTLQSIEAPAS
jgi:lysophospholipase L1-like esterase